MRQADHVESNANVDAFFFSREERMGDATRQLYGLVPIAERP